MTVDKRRILFTFEKYHVNDGEGCQCDAMCEVEWGGGGTISEDVDHDVTMRSSKV
jgi:hypothetical protein